MINSLFKDSHITQNICHPLTYNSRMGASSREQKNSTAPAKNGISVNKPAEINFSGLSSADKTAKIYTAKWLKDFFNMATENQVVFNAAFSLILTCILRPASIMALPGNKKNKDDKKYAAAHSVASGIIGYVMSSILFNPIASATKKIAADPDKFLKPVKEYLKTKANMDMATAYVKMLPEAIVAPGRAMITIPLIPLILKYVFGWEKKSKQNVRPQLVPIIENPAAVNFKSTNMMQSKAFQNFNGGLR